MPQWSSRAGVTEWQPCVPAVVSCWPGSSCRLGRGGRQGSHRHRREAPLNGESGNTRPPQIAGWESGVGRRVLQPCCVICGANEIADGDSAAENSMDWVSFPPVGRARTRNGGRTTRYYVLRFAQPALSTFTIMEIANYSWEHLANRHHYAVSPLDLPDLLCLYADGGLHFAVTSPVSQTRIQAKDSNPTSWSLTEEHLKCRP